MFVEFREHDGRKVRQYLAHQDRDRAKAEADAMAAAFSTAPMYRGGPPTLQALFDIYLREVTPSKTAGTQQHDRTAALLFLRAWGEQREPLTLGLRDWQQFIAAVEVGVLHRRVPKA